MGLPVRVMAMSDNSLLPETLTAAVRADRAIAIGDAILAD